MSRRVETIENSSTIYQGAVKMARLKIGSLSLSEVQARGDTHRRRRVTSSREAAGRKEESSQVCYGKPIITTTSGARVEEAAKAMATSNIKKLPLVDGGKLTGIVTQTDIVGSSFDLVTALKELVRARYRPPDFQP